MRHWKGNKIYEAKVNTEKQQLQHFLNKSVCLSNSLSLCLSIYLSRSVSLSTSVYPLSHKIHDKSNMLISF